MAPAADEPSLSAAPTAAGETLVRLGRITGTHGIKGALKLSPDNPDSKILPELKRVFLEHGGRFDEHKLLSVAHAGRGQFKIVLDRVTDRDQAARLRGSVLYAAAADLPALGPGEFYYFQALGCEVELTDGRRLGRIEDVFFSGAHDIWVVRHDGAEYLIPVIADVVRSLDLKARRVTIEPIPGLLD